MQLGIIGAGVIVQSRHAPILRSLSDIKVDWICDLRLDLAQKVQNLVGAKRACTKIPEDSEVDAVLLATPVGTRASFWELAAQRHWSVFCEKPIALGVSDLDHLKTMIDESECDVMTGYARRFSLAHAALRSLSQSGSFDDLRRIHVANCSTWSNTGITGSWFVSDPSVAGGGVLLETGSHLLDQVANALNLKFSSVEQYEQIVVPGFTETECQGAAIVQYGERQIPFDFRFSVRTNSLNGIFLELPHGYVHCDSSYHGHVCFRDRKMRKVFSFDDLADTPASNVESATEAAWNQFKSTSNASKRRGEELERTRFVVQLIERCYCKVQELGRERAC